jgi:hypothetical protein
MIDLDLFCYVVRDGQNLAASARDEVSATSVKALRSHLLSPIAAPVCGDLPGHTNKR